MAALNNNVARNGELDYRKPRVQSYVEAEWHRLNPKAEYDKLTVNDVETGGGWGGERGEGARRKTSLARLSGLAVLPFCFFSRCSLSASAVLPFCFGCAPFLLLFPLSLGSPLSAPLLRSLSAPPFRSAPLCCFASSLLLLSGLPLFAALLLLCSSFPVCFASSLLLAACSAFFSCS